MNKKGILFLIGIIIVIGGFCFFLWKTYQEKKNAITLKSLIEKKKTYDELIQISYSSSGDSNGNMDVVTLILKEKILKTEYKAIHSDPILVKEYTISDEDINYLKEQIEKYNFPEWKDLESDDEVIAYDAPSTGITFLYDNSANHGSKYEYYHIDFDDKMPKDAREVLYTFNKEFHSLIKEENLIKEYEEKEES